MESGVTPKCAEIAAGRWGRAVTVSDRQGGRAMAGCEQGAHHHKSNEQKVDQDIHESRKMRGGTMVALSQLVKQVRTPVLFIH